MKLPSNYLDSVHVGVCALRAVGARLRETALKRPEMPELWLSIRDVEGLAGRLAETSDWEWRHGFGDMTISPQDLGVLHELLALGRAGPIQISVENSKLLVDLRDFLRSYCDGEFELDEPAA